jgi:aryl-alcohol dehydrogenase-like predicted oxidoreductase
MVNSVEMSLRNLQSDYIDLLYLHAWDSTTRVEEILRGLDDLVRSGKVLYVGISNTVAWQIARMQTIADLRGYSPLVALQIEYNLLERTVERDLIPMAREMGLGVIPWSPLACGILAGKYSEADLRTTRANESSSRRELLMETHRLSERALEIADVVKNVAAEVGRSPAQIALAWTLENPAVTSPIIGARTLRQLEDNLGALDVEFTESQYRYLSDASRIALGFPHDYLSWLLASSFMSSCMSITR